MFYDADVIAIEGGNIFIHNIYPIEKPKAAWPNYIERILEHEATGVIVQGKRIHRTAELTVQELTSLNEEAFKALCALIREAMESDASVCALRIWLTAEKHVPAWQDVLDVSIPVGEAFEGKPLLVLGCSQKRDACAVWRRGRAGHAHLQNGAAECISGGTADSGGSISALSGAS